ncbi:hypothetical protein [Dongia deserti]|uniref:hypothetical protein n=1 Tax=Dongia deserti TaxID=2268030 RepID=UPI0013C536B7|nr:hypothetical protein [Dongia deserti]
MGSTTPADKPRTCPVDGCEQPLQGERDILCAGHWDALPEAQREEVRRRYRAWRCDRPQWRWRTGNDYILAVNNAIRAAGRQPEKPEEMPA